MADSSGPARQQGQIGAANPKRPVILVVEDEVLVRLMIADELRQAGFSVVESANADEALAVLQSGTEAAVVVSDIRMPGAIDGIGLASLVRREFPEIRIVLASSHLPAVESLEHDGFFSKPYDLAEIVRHLKALTS